MDLDWGQAVLSQQSYQATRKRPATGGTSARPTKASKKKPSASERNAGKPLQDSNVLLCGSACTGLGTEHWSIPEAAPDKTLKFLFWCEKDDHARQFLNDNVKVETKFTDVHAEFAKEAPYVDIFTAGFPCQSFSVAGHKEGTKCKKNGKTIGGIIEYIKRQQPRVVVLENVKGLLMQHPRTLKSILATIEAVGDKNMAIKC